MAASFRTAITAEQNTALLSTMKALTPFINLRETMPLQYVKAFMLVATNEGRYVTWYADKAGVSPSLMTRHLSDLGEVNRYHKPGFGLVEQFDDPVDKRFRLMRLTTKGKGIVNQVVGAMSGRGNP